MKNLILVFSVLLCSHVALAQDATQQGSVSETIDAHQVGCLDADEKKRYLESARGFQDLPDTIELTNANDKKVEQVSISSLSVRSNNLKDTNCFITRKGLVTKERVELIDLPEKISIVRKNHTGLSLRQRFGRTCPKKKAVWTTHGLYKWEVDHILLWRNEAGGNGELEEGTKPKSSDIITDECADRNRDKLPGYYTHFQLEGEGVDDLYLSCHGQSMDTIGELVKKLDTIFDHVCIPQNAI